MNINHFSRRQSAHQPTKPTPTKRGRLPCKEPSATNLKATLNQKPLPSGTPSPEFGAGPREFPLSLCGPGWVGMPLPSDMPSPELGAGPVLTAKANNVAINAAIALIILTFYELDFGFYCRFVSHGGGCATFKHSPCHAHSRLVWGSSVSCFCEPKSAQKHLQTGPTLGCSYDGATGESLPAR